MLSVANRGQRKLKLYEREPKLARTRTLGGGDVLSWERVIHIAETTSPCPFIH
jgi:hypothetical protein